MQLTPESPRLNKLPFFVADGALLLAAWLIFNSSAKPLQAAPLFAITVCVALGAVLAVIPFLLNYTREREEQLAERQRSLEALARTTADAAEQIGIAAAGLHTVTELARKNLQAAAHLPEQLQEKISALDARRAAETAQLEAAAEKIAHAAAELARLETGLRKPRAAKTSAPAEPPSEPSAVAEVAPAAAEPVGQPAAPAPNAEPPDAPPPPAAPEPPVSHAPAVAAAVAAAEALVKEITPEEMAVTAPPFAMSRPAVAAPKSPPAPASATPASAPAKRKRAKPADAETPSAAPAASPAESAEAGDSNPPIHKHSGDTNPILELGISDDTPLSPEGDYPPADVLSPTPPPFSRVAPSPRPAKTARLATESAGESALASDGATRLIATAYIGIGNKLFIRGDGPGLRPDVGVPLSFVSIGKWRWETADATAPVTVRLYKNDQQECAALGPVTLQPGHQHEVTADF